MRNPLPRSPGAIALAIAVLAYLAGDLSTAVAGDMAVATPVHAVTDHYGAVSVVDPYRWLEDPSSPAVQAWTLSLIHI